MTAESRGESSRESLQESLQEGATSSDQLTKYLQLLLKKEALSIEEDGRFFQTQDGKSPGKKGCMAGDYHFGAGLKGEPEPELMIHNSKEPIFVLPGTLTLLAELAAMTYKGRGSILFPGEWQKTGSGIDPSVLVRAKYVQGFQRVEHFADRKKKQTHALIYQNLRVRRVKKNHQDPATERMSRPLDEIGIHQDQKNFADTMVIAIRGTDSLWDMSDNLRFLRTSHPNGWGKVHRGFKNYVDDLLQEGENSQNGESFREKLQRFGKIHPIFLTGHSLGGAAAVYLASILVGEGYHVAGVATMGAPRVGNKAFVRQYNSQLGSRTVQIRNHMDVIPFLPPRRLGFRHVGRQLWMSSEGSLLPVSASPFKDTALFRLDRIRRALRDHIGPSPAWAYVAKLRNVYNGTLGCNLNSHQTF